MDLSQTGTSKMPFNVNQPVIYSIDLMNSGSFMRYNVVLDVGPDYRDYTITKRYTKTVDLDSGTSKAIEFKINFRSPELCQGEFCEWASDPDDTTTWERCWYRTSITSKMGGKMAPLESYDGNPTLMKMITIYKDAEVSPRMGTNETLYDYQLDVFSSADDNVTLQVAPETTGPWNDVNTKSYTTPGTWQTLKWENVSLDFDFVKAHYKFVGRKQSETSEGPFWPIDYEYGNESVAPNDGFSDTPFSYGLDFKANKALDVVLNVWDIDQNLFRPMGRMSYTSAPEWDLLEWHDIKPSEQIGSEGSSSYYFSFYYPGSESPLGTSQDDGGKVYLGPSIILIKFGNTTVTPDEGSTIAQYTYGVQVDTGLPCCDIELQTCEPGSSIWKSQGIATYNGDREVSWDNITFECGLDGVVKYRFLKVASPPAVYDGPTLTKQTIIGDVTPARGVLQVFYDKNNRYNYTYTVGFENVEEDELWVELLVRAPKSTWKTVGEKKQYDVSVGDLSWTLKPFSDVEFLGNAEYKFLVNGVNSNKVFKGPEIVAMYKGLNFEKNTGSPNKYNYMAQVNSSENLTVDLIHSNDNVNWENLNDEKRYVANTGWKTLVWSSKPGYRYYEMDITFYDETLTGIIPEADVTLEG